MNNDIIETVQDESTDWASRLVVAPKHNNPSEVRVCGDYRQANNAIRQERHLIPSVDELLQASYHQTLLDKES